MSNRDIKLVNENGKIVGKDAETGETIPIELGETVADSVRAERTISDRAQADEISSERIRDVYRADEAIPLSGVAQIPVENIGSQGLRNITVRK